MDGDQDLISGIFWLEILDTGGAEDELKQETQTSIGLQGDGRAGNRDGRSDPLAGLAEQFNVHPNEIQDWKWHRIEGAEDVFGGEATKVQHNEQEVEELHAKIGQLARQKTTFCPKCSEAIDE